MTVFAAQRGLEGGKCRRERSLWVPPKGAAEKSGDRSERRRDRMAGTAEETG
jgi:hypothetical protein